MDEIDDICKQINTLSQKLQEKIKEKLKIMKKKNTLIQNTNPHPAGLRRCRRDRPMLNWIRSLRAKVS